jgi:hypothetical protein
MRRSLSPEINNTHRRIEIRQPIASTVAQTSDAITFRGTPLRRGHAMCAHIYARRTQLRVCARAPALLVESTKAKRVSINALQTCKPFFTTISIKH